MSYLIICTVALAVSGLTLFSGFGLGTLLMPAFAIFFPVEVAVAATAIVHLANNIFKAGLFGEKSQLSHCDKICPSCCNFRSSRCLVAHIYEYGSTHYQLYTCR